jgi:hypothetical protein
MKPGTLSVPSGSTKYTPRTCDGFDLSPPLREKTCGTMRALTAPADGEGTHVFMLGGCQVKGRLL